MCAGMPSPPLFSDAAFDAIVSWLALLHIPERPRLLARLARMLRRGGQRYIEDLFQRAPFAQSDLPDVRQTVFGVTLTSIADYVRDLHEAGFTEISHTDLSDDWTTFCGERMGAWQANRPRHVRVHGEQIYTQLDTFYTAVSRLLSSGSLGGVRLVARLGCSVQLRTSICRQCG